MTEQMTRLGGMTWVVGEAADCGPPRAQARGALWDACREAWLASKGRRSGSSHTVRAYETAHARFAAWIAARGISFERVTTRVAAEWAGHLADVEGLAASTVNARVAALSSFYSFAMERFTMNDEQGVERGLHQGVNPFAGVERPQVQPYGKAVYPGQDEVARMLAACDLDTARGWRDRAIVLGLLTMAQRVDAWLTVTWGQIHQGDVGYYFEYRAKGGLTCKAAVHDEVMHAVEQWLRRARRWPLQPRDHVFTAADPERAARLPGVGRVDAGQPLSNTTVNGMLQALARKAGVDPVRAHAHGLRHAGARWMRAAGADVWDLQRVLGHKSISTTQIYVEEVLDEPVNKWGAEIARQLSLF